MSSSESAHDEIRRLQGELLHREAALRTVLESTELGLVEVDLQDLRVTASSAGLRRMLGGSLVLPLALPEMVSNAERERLVTACALARDTARQVDLLGVHCGRPGHHPLAFDLRIFPVVLDRHPTSTAFIAFSETEVDRGHDPSPPLDAALEFAAAATHDLMAPLQTLVGFLDLLAGSANERLDAHDRAMIQRALHATTSMRGTIVDMLAWARTGSLSGSSAPFLLTDVVERSLANLNADAGTTRIEVRLQGLPQVQASAGIVSRVIQNLVLNALRFVPSEGGVIEIAASMDPNGSRLVVSVSDNGPGIPAEERDKIFQLFHSDGGGLGIGLAFCRRAIRACRGEIWLDPETSSGACFRFSLPLA